MSLGSATEAKVPLNQVNLSGILPGALGHSHPRPRSPPPIPCPNIASSSPNNLSSLLPHPVLPLPPPFLCPTLCISSLLTPCLSMASHCLSLPHALGVFPLHPASSSRPLATPCLPHQLNILLSLPCTFIFPIPFLLHPSCPSFSTSPPTYSTTRIILKPT